MRRNSPRAEGLQRAWLRSLGGGGDCLRFEGPRRGALKRGGVCSTADEVSEEPYRDVGPWAEYVFWMFYT
jgi:hypothetical protein